MKTLEDYFKSFAFPKIDEEYAYNAGYDSGRNGSNQENCDFRIFSTPENTKAWERGRAKAEEEKLKA